MPPRPFLGITAIPWSCSRDSLLSCTVAWGKPFCILGWEIASRECKRPLLCCYCTVHIQTQDKAPWHPPCPGYSVSAPICCSGTPSLQFSSNYFCVCPWGVYSQPFFGSKYGPPIFPTSLKIQTYSTNCSPEETPGRMLVSTRRIWRSLPSPFLPEDSRQQGRRGFPALCRDPSSLPQRSVRYWPGSGRAGAGLRSRERAGRAGARSARRARLGAELPCRQCPARRRGAAGSGRERRREAGNGGERRRGRVGAARTCQTWAARAPLERRRPRAAPPAPRRGRCAGGAAGAERSPPETAAPAPGGAPCSALSGAGAGGAGGGRRGGGRRPPGSGRAVPLHSLLPAEQRGCGAAAVARRAAAGAARSGAEDALSGRGRRRGRGAGQWRDPLSPGPGRASPPGSPHPPAAPQLFPAPLRESDQTCGGAELGPLVPCPLLVPDGATPSPQGCCPGGAPPSPQGCCPGWRCRN